LRALENIEAGTGVQLKNVRIAGRNVNVIEIHGDQAFLAGSVRISGVTLPCVCACSMERDVRRVCSSCLSPKSGHVSRLDGRSAAGRCLRDISTPEAQTHSSIDAFAVLFRIGSVERISKLIGVNAG
jgi:hypothetical protein